MATRDRTSSKRIRGVGPWTEQTSSSGKKYYYNTETEVSQWEKPDVWKEWERRVLEEKVSNTNRNNGHDRSSSRSETPSRPSTSQPVLSKISTKEISPTSSSSLTSSNHHHQNGYHHKSRISGHSDQPPTKRPHLDHHRDSPSQVERAKLIPPPALLETIPPISLPQPPPLMSVTVYPPLQLEPPPPQPTVMDEPMDVADSPPQSQPQQETKDEVPIPFPSVRSFDEQPYIRFYKGTLTAPLRKSLISESTMNEVRKNNEKLHKSDLQLMELETSIISVHSLLCTAQTKSLLLTEKYQFLGQQLDAIRKQQIRTEPEEIFVKEEPNSSTSPKRISSTDADMKPIVQNGYAVDGASLSLPDFVPPPLPSSFDETLRNALPSATHNAHSNGHTLTNS